MHPSSIEEMKKFRDKYTRTRRILDVGGMDINGSYRDLFPGFEYVSMDIEPGKGVDVVGWGTIYPGTFDFIISGQTFEHAADDAELMEQIAKALKPGGHCCIIAPSSGPVHNYPKDYRRYTPEVFKNLAEDYGLEVVESRVNDVLPWCDCVLIARKPAEDACT